MAVSAATLMTAEEFYHLDDRYGQTDRAWELIRGRVVEVSLSGIKHGLVCANVAAVLGNFAERRKVGFICSNGSGLIVERAPDTVLGPDIAYMEDDAIVISDITDTFVTTPPVLVVEVLSSDDKAGPLFLRVKRFLNFGIALVWLVDFQERIAIVFRRGREFRIFGEQEELTGEDVLPDLRCKVADFFAVPGQ